MKKLILLLALITISIVSIGQGTFGKNVFGEYLMLKDAGGFQIILQAKANKLYIQNATYLQDTLILGSASTTPTLAEVTAMDSTTTNLVTTGGLQSNGETEIVGNTTNITGDETYITAATNFQVGDISGDNSGTNIVVNSEDDQITLTANTNTIGDPASTNIRVFKEDNEITLSAAETSLTGSIAATQYKLSALNTAPANAGATGTTGEIRVTASYIYVCTSTNTWVRSALATW